MKSWKNLPSGKQKKRRLIRIRVTYLNKDLQRLTEKKEETISIPEGTRSGDFLDFLQERYPAIFEKFGPGYLGFVLNGEKPHVLTLLKDGDHYEFTTWTDEKNSQFETQRFKGAITELPKGEFSMPKWMECTWRRLACNKKTCRICGRLMRDRQKHLRAGDDPDSMKAALEDVSRNFSEALENLKEWSKQNGIEITNLENIKEPPPPAHFPLYNIVARWRKEIMDLINAETGKYGAWINSEQVEDLMWYANLLAAKTYRQLCNCWHIEEGDEYGRFDHEYTKYILGESIKILKNSLGELVTLAAPKVRVGDYNKFSENKFVSLYIKLTALENKILLI